MNKDLNWFMHNIKAYQNFIEVYYTKNDLRYYISFNATLYSSFHFVELTLFWSSISIVLRKISFAINIYVVISIVNWRKFDYLQFIFKQMKAISYICAPGPAL